MSKLDHTIWMESAIGERFTEGEARELHYISKREKYGDGEKLFQEGNPAVELFLIVNGDVRVVKKGVDDRPTVLATLSRGAILGEMSLLTGEERSASAIAHGDCEVLRVAWNDFKPLLDSEPQVAFKVVSGLATLLAKRLKLINRKVAELTTREVTYSGKSAKPIEEFADFKKKLMSDWSF